MGCKRHPEVPRCHKRVEQIHVLNARLRMLECWRLHFSRKDPPVRKCISTLIKPQARVEADWATDASKLASCIGEFTTKWGTVERNQQAMGEHVGMNL